MQAQLDTFNRANFASQQAYRQFLHEAQNFDFKTAGELQLMVTAQMEVALDAFMALCRMQQQMNSR